MINTVVWFLWFSRSIVIKIYLFERSTYYLCYTERRTATSGSRSERSTALPMRVFIFFELDFVWPNLYAWHRHCARITCFSNSQNGQALYAWRLQFTWLLSFHYYYCCCCNCGGGYSYDSLVAVPAVGLNRKQNLT